MTTPDAPDSASDPTPDPAGAPTPDPAGAPTPDPALAVVPVPEPTADPDDIIDAEIVGDPPPAPPAARQTGPQVGPQAGPASAPKVNIPFAAPPCRATGRSDHRLQRRRRADLLLSAGQGGEALATALGVHELAVGRSAFPAGRQTTGGARQVGRRAARRDPAVPASGRLTDPAAGARTQTGCPRASFAARLGSLGRRPACEARAPPCRVMFGTADASSL